MRVRVCWLGVCVLGLAGCSKEASDTGTPDDTDTDTDTDTACTVAYYTDADGDGFGDPDAPVESCEASATTVANSDDCADDDPDTHPGAVELCDVDAHDQDCDGGEEGIATFYPTVGPPTDLTEILAAGTEGAPAAWTSEGDGTLRLCDGTWYANLVIEDSVSISGEYGADRTIVDAGGVGRPLTVHGPASVSSVTLTGGVGDTDCGPDSAHTSGGGLCCDGGGNLALEDVTIAENTAWAGGGAWLDCTLDALEARITANTADDAGGGLYLSGSGAALADSDVWDNTATGPGGGLYANDAALTLDGSLVEGNEANEGGGLYMVSSTATCLGGATEIAGFHSNSGAGGGVYSVFGTFIASTCDFGPTGTSTDNHDYDVYVQSISVTTYEYGDDATFSCSQDCFP